jgi:signal transduction histidine kinase
MLCSINTVLTCMAVESLSPTNGARAPTPHSARIMMLEKLAGPTVSVQIDRAQPSSVVQVDRRQLTATLLNLVANARDAMDKCGTITIGAVGDTAHWVRIDVKDDGCGMAADVLAHAAEPFYSTKAVGAGSGLGLSMVDGFVRQSGGMMTITSTPQRGTTIRLQLPRAEATS